MNLDVRNILILRHPNKEEVLLLKHDSNKKLFPSLVTGIGGKLELNEGEGDDLDAAMWREFLEETKISKNTIYNTRLRLVTLVHRQDEVVILMWYIGDLQKVPDNLLCTEGSLIFYPISELDKVEFIPSARGAIKFVVNLSDNDRNIYCGIYDKDMNLIVNNR